MANSGFKVMDSDMHIFEPPDLWQRYIDPKFEKRAPVGLNRHRRDMGLTLDGVNIQFGAPLLPGRPQPAANPQVQERVEQERRKQDAIYADGEENGWDPASQLRAMDTEGIDIAVLFPSRGLTVLAIDGMDPDLALAISQAYNNWLYEFCQGGPDRLYGAAMVPPFDVEYAVTETRRCVEELGLRCIFMRPNVVNGRNWHDPYYDPLWAECQRLQIPVGLHEGANPPYINQVGSSLGSNMLIHACSHPMEMMLAAVSFCGGGVLARFPELKVGFLEANCSWAPWLMWRLDEHYEAQGYRQPELKKPPSEHFKEQCFVNMEPGEWPAKHLEDLGYRDTVVFSTDYPHGDGQYPHAVDSFLSMDLSPDAKRKVLWDNCARLYNFS